MNLSELQSKLIDNKDDIELVLESLGFENIKYKPGYFQFPRIGGDNPKGCVLYTSNLHYECFTRAESGNLWTLVMEIEELSFRQALNYVCGIVGLENVEYHQIISPFDGFYKSLTESEYDIDDSLMIYPESILKDYQGYSYRFYKDGISYPVQNRFEIGMDLEANAIAIPIRSSNGNLVGVKYRNNEVDCTDKNRYWAKYQYSKTKVVYGVAQNYKNIVSKSKVIVVEAEKSVMQAASFHCNLCVAIAGHNISEIQSRIIRALLCEQIIVAFDEGVDKDEMIQACEKLMVLNGVYKPKIGYVIDEENKILKKGSKDSPTDHGKEDFTELIKHYVKWINY